MAEQIEPVCGGCHYFRAADAWTGACHRFPPSYVGENPMKETHHWRFPIVSVHAWCGEFLPKSEA